MDWNDIDIDRERAVLSDNRLLLKVLEDAEQNAIDRFRRASKEQTEQMLEANIQLKLLETLNDSLFKRQYRTPTRRKTDV